MQGQAQGHPGFQWPKKVSHFYPPRPCPPRSAANRGAGLKMLSGVGLCASGSVILQRGKLRSKGMPDWFLCPEATSGGILVSMDCSLHSQQPAPCLGLNPCLSTTKKRTEIYWTPTHPTVHTGNTMVGIKTQSCLWGPRGRNQRLVKLICSSIFWVLF